MPDTTLLADLFRTFAQREARGSSPLYERLCSDLASNEAAMALMLKAPPAQRRPNLLLAAVHYLLLDGTAHPLAGYYPSVGGDRAPDEAGVGAFVDFCDHHREPVVELLRTRATQTNEIARTAMLLAALNQIEASAPLGLIDVGASAGLNLLCDRYRIVFGNEVSDRPVQALSVFREDVLVEPVRKRFRAVGGLGPAERVAHRRTLLRVLEQAGQDLAQAGCGEVAIELVIDGEGATGRNERVGVEPEPLVEMVGIWQKDRGHRVRPGFSDGARASPGKCKVSGCPCRAHVLDVGQHRCGEIVSREVV